MIVHDERRGQDFELAQFRLGRAEEVVLLGFGFNPVNIQRLRLDQIYRRQEHNCNWFASRKDMGDSEIAIAKTDLQGLPIYFPPNPSWGINEFLKNVDCLKPGRPEDPPQDIIVDSGFDPLNF